MGDVKWEDTVSVEEQPIKWEDTTESKDSALISTGKAAKAASLGFAKGATFGFMDEASALSAAPLNLLAKDGVGAFIPTSVNEAKELISKLRNEYKKERKQISESFNKAIEESPIAGTIGEISGAIASPLGKVGMGVKAIKAAGMTKQALTPLLKTTAGAGLQGAAYGLGASEKDVLDTMSEGTEKERQELKDEILVPAATGASLTGIIGGASLGLKKGYNLITKLRGETPTDALQKSLIKVTGANASEAKALEKTSEGIADTMSEYSILKNIATSKRGMFNNVNDAINTKINPELKQIYQDLGDKTLISNNEVAERALRKSYDLNPNTDMKLIKKIEKEAANLADNESKSVGYAWETRKAFDKAAFTKAKSLEPGSSLESQYSAIMRDAYQDALNNATMNTLGGDAFTRVRKLSNDYSNLKKIGNVLDDSKNRLGMSLVDRLTIGAVYAGLANPVIGGSFFLGRELGRGVGPKTRFVPQGQPLTPKFARGMYGPVTSQYDDQE